MGASSKEYHDDTVDYHDKKPKLSLGSRGKKITLAILAAFAILAIVVIVLDFIEGEFAHITFGICVIGFIVPAGLLGYWLYNGVFEDDHNTNRIRLVLAIQLIMIFLLLVACLAILAKGKDPESCVIRTMGGCFKNAGCFDAASWNNTICVIPN